MVASEDHRFFYHQGYDVRGLARAVTTLGQGGGGSTITQQLVKNLLLSQVRLVHSLPPPTSPDRDPG